MKVNNNLVIFMPSIEGGGVEKNFFLISNYLSKKIRKVYVITADKSFTKKLTSKIYLITPNSYFWSKRGRYTKYFICLILLLKLNFTLKNFLVFSFQANIYCILLSKILGKRIISRSNSSPQGWSRNIIKNLIFKKVLNIADKVIVNSYDFKRDLDKKFNINSTCIYNPLNKKEVENLGKKKLNFKLFRKKNSLKIINVGRFVDQKDQITILKSVNLIKDKISIELILIGGGIKKEIMINFIKRNKLNKIVKIMNFLTNPYKYIKKSDVFVLSSTFEGLPNVLLEAQCLKTFIISSDCSSGPREILLNGKAGFLFKVKDNYDLSKKILKYFYNKEKLNKKIKIGYQNLYRFKEKNNLEKYFSLIKKFI